MPKKSGADKPKTGQGLEYHLHTAPKDLAPLCITVGAQGRVQLIGGLLKDTKYFTNKYRGLISCTGTYKGQKISICASGMGGPSLGITSPEAIRCGARIIIRVGSCATLIREASVKQSIIVNAAVRFDGASLDWAPIEVPAVADYRVVTTLEAAAQKIAPQDYWVGNEVTTTCFNVGQGRPDLSGVIPPRMMARHKEMIRLKMACYSMEAASLFIYCMSQGIYLPSGAINAIYGNRITNKWSTEDEREAGDMQASMIALEALLILAQNPRMQYYMNLKLPKPRR